MRARAHCIHPAAHPCVAPPPPSQLYNKTGSIDVGTFENGVFYWGGRLLNLENIPCSYWDHAGIWDPATHGNHSYARIRDFLMGAVVANITLTVGYGFLTPLQDYTTGTLWLFGTPADRCVGNGSPTTVRAWWCNDPSLQAWASATAFDYGSVTHNVQVTRVGPLGGSSGPEIEAWEARQRCSTLPLASAAAPPVRHDAGVLCLRDQQR